MVHTDTYPRIGDASAICRQLMHSTSIAFLLQRAHMLEWLIGDISRPLAAVVFAMDMPLLVLTAAASARRRARCRTHGMCAGPTTT